MNLEEAEKITEGYSEFLEEEVKIQGGENSTYLIATGFYINDEDYRLEARTNMTQEDIAEIFLKYLRNNEELRKLVLSGIAEQFVENKMDEMVKGDPVYDPSFSDIIKRVKFQK